jgi:alpha-amylase
MAKILSESGGQYTVLDDSHFVAAGMDAEKLSGYYTTEDEGYNLNVFPISKKMRYLIPFGTIEKIMEYFKKLIKENPQTDPVVVMADDGEKFGMWPTTYKHVYENQWLDFFLTALEENSDIVETITFSEILKTKKSSGRVYLPCSSYEEMSEWTLPVEAQQSFQNILKRFKYDDETKRFLHGGFWRNFLTKYEEANNMHKKMLYVSEKIEKCLEYEKRHSQKAAYDLYAGQCNCAYWHGVFGGLYLPHLRNAIYNKLLKAEEIYNKTMLKRSSWNVFDFNCDSHEEYLYESKAQNIYVLPSNGGSIFEWDIFKFHHNLLDVLTRRYEPYHKKLKDNVGKTVLTNDDDSQVHTIHSDLIRVKEMDLDKYLVYDKYKRVSLIDHFFANSVTHEDCMFNRYEEKGDFFKGAYKPELKHRREFLKKNSRLVLSRFGKVDGKDVKVIKEIFPTKSGYDVKYEIKNNSNEDLDICFAPEQIFAFTSKNGDDYSVLKNVDIWKRYDSYLNMEIEIKFSEKSEIFVYPVETVSNSDNGFEKTYQGTVVLPLVKCLVKPGEVKKFSFVTSANLKKQKGL